MLTGKAKKYFDELQAEAAADKARAAAAPAQAPAQVDRRHDGRTVDRASGREFMLVKNIVPDPLQPRKDFDPVEIGQIAATLKTHGQLQPVRIEWKPELERWQIEDGEKRWMAAQAAGVDRLWCMFIQKETPADERLEKQLMANCLRSDLKGIDRANAFKRLMDMKGWNGRQVAERLQLDPATVTRSLQLLELPPEIQADIVAGKIPPAAGVELSKLQGDDQKKMRGAVLSEGMTRDDVRKTVKEKKRKGHKRPAKVQEESTTHKLPFQDDHGHRHQISITSPHAITKTEAARLLRLAADVLDEQERGRAAA